MNIERALKASGYANAAHRDERICELTWLAEQASQHSIIAELG